MTAVQDLNKPAHMGTLEMVRQIDIHVDGGHRVLHTIFFIKDSDGIGDIFDADLADINSSAVRLALDVFHGRKSICIIAGCGNKILTTLPLHTCNLAKEAADRLFQLSHVR